MDQLKQAVSLALQAGADPQVKLQAIEFCTHVQQAPQEWWQPALELSGQPDLPQEVVFFSFQVLLAAIKLFAPASPELRSIQEVIWARASRGELAAMPVSTRTKAAETLAQLFLVTYPNSWPTFFADLIQLSNPDLYLRVLKIIHEEIGDQAFDRSPEQVRQANDVKDAIRANDMQAIIDSLIDLLASENTDVAQLALQVIGGWVSWIDLPMLLAERDGALVPRIMKHFTPGDSARFSAAAALNEMLLKKMAPDHKIELVRVLQLVPLLVQFNVNGNDLEFEERVAKLTNYLGMELVKALAVNSEPLVLEIMPKALEFLGNEYDDTSVQVVPFIAEYIQFVRREQRPEANQPPKEVPTERAEVLRAVLDKAIAKSGYALDDDHDDDEDDDAEFADLRAKLKVLQEQIASIHLGLFLDIVVPFIRTRLANSASAPWQQAELALYEMDVLGDVAKTMAVSSRKAAGAAGTLQTVQTPADTALYDLSVALVDSVDTFAATSHPTVQLWCMEFILKFYPSLFVDRKDADDAAKARTRRLLEKAVAFFVGPAGIHNRVLRVRLRAWYLLFRLFKHIMGRDKRDILEAVAVQVFSSVAPLLAVHVPQQSQNSPSPSDESADEDDSVFSSQLYLFELCGMLIVSQLPEKREELARQLLAGIFTDIDRAVTAAKANPADITAHKRVHHNLIALSAYTRGVASVPVTDGQQLAEMTTATQMVVAVVEQLYSDQLVRDAARVAYTRLVELLGSRILVEISRLIDILLVNAQPSDLADLLSFLGQLSHRFKDDQSVFDMFTSLSTPLFAKVFAALQAAAADAAAETSGTVTTDAASRRKELVQAYLQFLSTLLTNRYGAVVLPVFENVAESLFHYASNGSAAGGLPNQKVAITLLGRMVQMWGTGKVPEDQLGAGKDVPLFGTDLVATKLTELCWTLPTKPDFKLRDAETRLVAMELGALQRAVWEARGAQYQEYLGGYLSQAGLPQPVIEDFGTKVVSVPVKDFKRYFYDLLVRAQS